MPELPEVHTTVQGLKKTVVGKTITDVWSDFHIGTAHGERQTIKNKKYFGKFRKLIRGAKIKSVGRKGKNILIHLNNTYIILVHMKMTGHLMYGATDKFVHLIFKLKKAKDLVLSDMRKFASVSIVKTTELNKHERLSNLGPDPLKIKEREFIERVKRKKDWPIKSALMDQTVLAGIGNIYSDETLWAIGVHPLSHISAIPNKKFEEMFGTVQKILRFSIKHGGDSKSDYRNIYGEKGGFQDFHKVYGRKNQKCSKRNCSGIIERIIIKGRSTHFCPKHQILYK